MPTNTELTLRVEAKVIALIAEAISGRIQMNAFDAGGLAELKELSTVFLGKVTDLDTNIQALT